MLIMKGSYQIDISSVIMKCSLLKIYKQMASHVLAFKVQ